MVPPSRRPPGAARDALLVAAAAVAVRAVYLIQVRRTPLFDYVHLDPLYYLEWGRRIAAGDWLGSEVFEQSPLYPYLLGGLFAIAGERLLLLRALQLALGAAACAGIGLLGRLAFDRRAGLAAGLLAACYGPFPFYEGQVMKSFLKYVLATAALVLLVRAPRAARPAVWLAGAGAALGLLGLVRDNALLLVPVMAAWAAAAVGGDRRRRLAAAASLALSAAAAVAPATLRNLAVSGDLVPVTSGGGEVFYIGNYPEANGAYLPPPWVRPSPAYEHEDFRAEAARRLGRPLTRAEASRYWFAEGLRAIRADPVRWLRLEARKLALFWNFRELPDNYSYEVFCRFVPVLRLLPGFGLVAPLALAGMAITRRRFRELLPLHLVLVTYLASVLLFFNFSRFRLPAVPVLLAFAGAALAGAIDAVRARAWRRAAAIAAAAGLLAIPLHADLTSVADAPGQEDLLIGYAWLDAGRPERAAEAFAAARLRIEAFARERGGAPPLELGSACFGQGSALLALGRAADALEPLRRAAALAPADPAPLRKLAEALRAAGPPDEARDALLRLVDLEPARFAAYFDLGSLAFDRRDAGDALAWFERGRERCPDMTDADRADYHLGVALVHLHLRGDRESALPHLREVLRLRPDHEQAASIRAALEAG
jgi:tetratricopeptide (TPR) repeat protein